MAELLIRFPTADRFAMFQDDIVTVKNLKAYLDASQYPTNGYWNLFTMPRNQTLAEKVGQTGRFKNGFYLSNQKGLGALGLVFDRETLIELLHHQHTLRRFLDVEKGWQSIDGGIVTALRKAGWKEWVHTPSLVQHKGTVSSMKPGSKHPDAETFPGEDFDALSLLASTATA